MPNSVKEEALIIEKFKEFFVNCVIDVMTSLPTFIPQSASDRHLFKKGLTAMDNIVYDLEHAESIRDIAKYINVEKVLKDFDLESIKDIAHKIESQALETVQNISSLCQDGERDEE